MTVEVVTFGCRLNAYESEVIRREAQAAGLVDTIVVNTCAVTAEAVRQSRQAIRRLARERPDSKIVVTGCAAQIEPTAFAAMTEVDRVLGNADKLQPGTWARTAAALACGPGAAEDGKILVNDIMGLREIAPHLIDGIEGKARAVVQVQNGCDRISYSAPT